MLAEILAVVCSQSFALILYYFLVELDFLLPLPSQMQVYTLPVE